MTYRFRVLEFILQKIYPLEIQQDGRFKKAVVPNLEAVQRMIRVPDLHLGLIAVAGELVSFVHIQVR